jgi:hypothetical protein
MPRRPRPKSGPHYLSAAQLAIVRRSWRQGLPRDEVCRLAGITIHVLAARRLDQLRDLERRTKGTGGRRRGVDPTEEEIWGSITAKIQSEWTDEERLAAWEGSRMHQDDRH